MAAAVGAAAADAADSVSGASSANDSSGAPAGHVLFVVPNRAGARTGNETSVQRHARLLRARGVTVEILRPDDVPSDAPLHLAADVVFAYHARRSGPRGAALAQQLGVPLVVVLTGTDLSLDLADRERRLLVERALARADAVLCGHDDEVAVARRLAPGARLVAVAPKSVGVPDIQPDLALHSEPHEIILLAVANVRPVKRLDVAVHAAAGLRAEGRPARLVVVGDVRDAEENARLVELAGGEDAWAAILHRAVPHEEMGGIYASADIVINTSDAEGGSNAVLEAMAHSRVVVASDVPGNAAFVSRDGSRGALYPVATSESGARVHDVQALVGYLALLARHPETREQMGQAAREHVREHHSEDAEADALLAACAAAMG